MIVFLRVSTRGWSSVNRLVAFFSDFVNPASYPAALTASTPSTTSAKLLLFIVLSHFSESSAALSLSFRLSLAAMALSIGFPDGVRVLSNQSVEAFFAWDAQRLAHVAESMTRDPTPGVTGFPKVSGGSACVSGMGCPAMS